MSGSRVIVLRIRLNKFLCVGMAVGLLLSAAPADAAPQHVIRMSILSPAESSWGDVTLKIKQFVESRTRGRVKMIWYMSGVMGDEPEEIKKIQRGELQGAGFTIVGLGMIQPAIRVLLLPFLLRNYAEVDYIIDSMFPAFQRMFAEAGYVLLGFTEMGHPRLFTQKPIRTLEDLRNNKVWTWAGEDLTELIIRDLGIRQVVPLTLFQAKDALEKGIVNAYYSTCYPQIALQWYQHTKYMSDFKIGYSPAALVMDKRFYDRLPPDIQTIIQQAVDFLLKPFREIIRKEEEAGCEGLLKRGITKYQTPPGFLEELIQRSEEGYFRYADDKYPRDLLEEILKRLKVFRSKQQS